MLHVLFAILKIILIILAAVVGLAILAVLAVLFVPFRYSVQAEKGKSITADIRVSWLFRIISVPVTYDGGLDVSIRIFGFTVKKLFGETAPESPAVSDEPQGGAAPGGEEPEKEEPKRKKEKAEKEKRESKAAAAESEGLKTEKEAGEEASDADAGQKDDETGYSKFRGIFDRITGIFKRLKETAAGVPEKIRGVLKKIKGIVSKVRDIRNLIFEEHMKQAIKLALRQLGYLLKKLMPKKISGRVRFGLSDPSKTGEILAVLGMTYPLTAERLEVVPDFEEEVIEGDISLEGYFRAVTVLIIGIRLIKDRNVRYVIKKLAA